MPAELERCVRHVLERPDFEPQEGRTAEESAYAICRATMGLSDDGSQDGAYNIPEEEMKVRVANEMARRKFGSLPVYRKRMVVAHPLGHFVNGEQEGEMTVSRLRQIADNFKKFPRQVPIFLMGDHDFDLERPPDGWVEGAMVGSDGQLQIDAKLHGEAVRWVLEDLVRGASIGTIRGRDYEGNEIGEVLQHVLLTNNPFDKETKVSVSQLKGGERPSLYFTALEGADMAENKKPEGKGADMAENKKPEGGAADAIDFKERVKALESIVREKDQAIAELAAAKENLLKEVERYRANPQLQEAVAQMKQMQRQLRAERVRRIIARMCENGQVVRDTVKWAFADSDETVLAGFESGAFRGNVELLEFALQTYPKQKTRNFHSGAPSEEGVVYTADQKDEIRRLGADPDLVEKTRAARNFTEFKRLKGEKKAS